MRWLARVQRARLGRGGKPLAEKPPPNSRGGGGSGGGSSGPKGGGWFQAAYRPLDDVIGVIFERASDHQQFWLDVDVLSGHLLRVSETR